MNLDNNQQELSGQQSQKGFSENKYIDQIDKMKNLQSKMRFNKKSKELIKFTFGQSSVQIIETENHNFIKKYQKQDNQQFEHYFNKEKDILELIRYMKKPQLLKIYEIDSENQSITSEYCKQGDLLNLVIYSNKFLSENTIRIIMSMIIKSYKQTQDLGYSHNDIKPHNIVLDEHFNAKLVDQGLSDKINLMRVKKFGTHVFQAPEMIIGYYHSDLETDMQALGSTMYDITFKDLFGSVQDRVHQGSELVKNIKQTNMFCNVLKKDDAIGLKILQRMLAYDPNERLRFEDIFDEGSQDEFIINVRNYFYLDQEFPQEQLDEYKSEMTEIYNQIDKIEA